MTQKKCTSGWRKGDGNDEKIEKKTKPRGWICTKKNKNTTRLPRTDATTRWTYSNNTEEMYQWMKEGRWR